ncbi:MAG: hypothetical protein R2881_11315, partial [Eubacteriales bacterium]
MKRWISMVVCVALAFASAGCALSANPAQAEKPAGQATTAPAATVRPRQTPVQPEGADISSLPELGATPEPDEPFEPDGKGVVNFTLVLHLEGWRDGTDEESFRRHAELLREYAGLFEQYGATMTL